MGSGRRGDSGPGRPYVGVTNLRWYRNVFDRPASCQARWPARAVAPFLFKTPSEQAWQASHINNGLAQEFSLRQM